MKCRYACGHWSTFSTIFVFWCFCDRHCISPAFMVKSALHSLNAKHLLKRWMEFSRALVLATWTCVHEIWPTVWKVDLNGKIVHLCPSVISIRVCTLLEISSIAMSVYAIYTKRMKDWTLYVCHVVYEQVISPFQAAAFVKTQTFIVASLFNCIQLHFSIHLKLLLQSSL